MLNSKVSMCLVVMMGLQFGCSTPGFRVSKNAYNKVEVVVSSDRVLLECEQISEENPNYMFMMQILDEKNTVSTFMLWNDHDKESCFDRIKAIGKVLKNNPIVTIGGFGDLDGARIVREDTYVYPKLGTFHSNGRVLGFRVITNENGQCYDARYGEEKPCPRGEFPIK